MKTLTKGNVVVEDIKVGDIHYEFEYGICIMTKVIEKPKQLEDGCWEWVSETISNQKRVTYIVNPKYSHYGPNIYDYEAYSGCRIIR